MQQNGEQEIKKARDKLKEIINKVERIIKNGQGIDQLDACSVELEQLHYPIYQMCQNAKLNFDIVQKALEVNDEINKYKEQLLIKKKEISQKKNPQRQINIENQMSLSNQNEELRLIKLQNQNLQAEIQTLKANQDKQNVTQKNLQEQMQIVINQNSLLQNEMQQLRNQFIQSNNVIQEKTQKIEQMESSINQIQRDLQNLNLIRLTDSQLQNSQIIQIIQNQLGNVNNQLIKLQENFKSQEFNSFQHSQDKNY